MKILGVVVEKKESDKAEGHILDFCFNSNSAYLSFRNIPPKCLSFRKKQLAGIERDIIDKTLFTDFWHYKKGYIYDRLVNVNFEELSDQIQEECQSISLSVFLAPLSSVNTYLFPYTHCCFTGIVECSNENKPEVNSVIEIDAKYDIYSEYVNNERQKNVNSIFAFVYVSANEFKPEKINENIKIIQINPYTSVETLLDKLSSGFRRPKEKANSFNNSVYAKLAEYFESQNDNDKEISIKNKKISIKIYLSGNENSKAFFNFLWFDLFRTAIDKGYSFNLSISISKFLSNNELTSDDMPDSLFPKWWNKNKNEKSVDINEKLKRLDLFVRNQVEVLRRYVFEMYGYNDNKDFNHKGRLNIQINYADNEEIKLIGNNGTTENAIIFKTDEKIFAAFSDGPYFEYNEYNNETLPENINSIEKSLTAKKVVLESKIISREETEKLLEVLNQKASSAEILQKVGTIIRDLKNNHNKYLPFFTIYGLPGMGKSTIIKRITQLYEVSEKAKSKKDRDWVNDIHVISTDFMINERIFDDDYNSRHNPSIKAQKRDDEAVNNHVIYSREDYESFLPLGFHDMDIRNLVVKIGVKEATVTHDFIDLGGKEFLIEDTRYLLNYYGFITVFLCPYGKDKEECFNSYYSYYKDNPSLLDKAKRRNVYKLANPNEDKNIDYDPTKLTPEEWETFRGKLKEKIFDRRFFYYNRKYDAKVFKNGNVDDVTVDILKAILSVHKKWLENDTCLEK